jgi:hypothetical protein
MNVQPTILLLIFASCGPSLPELGEIIADFEQDVDQPFEDCQVGNQINCDETEDGFLQVKSVVACMVAQAGDCDPRRGEFGVAYGDGKGTSLRWYFRFRNDSGVCEYHYFATPFDLTEGYVVHYQCGSFSVTDRCEQIEGEECVEVERQDFSRKISG